MRSKFSITQFEADLVLQAAAAAATERPVSIAIVDDAGSLLVFRRMDGARAHSIELAMQKARLAAIVGVPSAAIQAAGNRDVTAGGVPIMSDGQCVGAIGISGAPSEEDVRLAAIGVAAFHPIIHS